MIDIKARLLSLESDFNNKYTSLADVYETLKSTNINLTYSEISEYLLSELDDLNPRGQIHFIDDDSIEEWVYTYGVPAFKRKNNQAIKFHDHINLFFDFIDLVDKNKINEISGFKYNFDIWGISWVKASDIFIERRKIEIALNCEIKTINKVKEPIQNIKATITKDNTKLLQQLTAKDEEILRLKEEIENLKKPELTKDKTEQEQAQSIQLSPVEEEPQGRISKAQRALFALLLSKLYPDGKIPNVNSVKDSINEELKKIGLSDVSYNTIAGLMKKT